MRRSSRSSVWFLCLCVDAILTFMTASLGAFIGHGYAREFFQVNSWLSRILALRHVLNFFLIGINSSGSWWSMWTIDFHGHGFSTGVMIAFPGCIPSLFLWLNV